tara:strand:- start:16885 stop:17385 length:501 start_codon:yes stop_codon:yes gene_type:complete
MARYNLNMNNLFLLRHAKSSWDNSFLSDHDRPLAKRGIQDSLKLADHLLDTSFDRIFCSSSKRTLETADLVLSDTHMKHNMHITDDLYHADINDVLNLLSTNGDTHENILLIGHNPTMQYLVEYLTDESLGNFPTCAFAHIKIKTEWCNIDKRSNSLEKFIRPKEL